MLQPRYAIQPDPGSPSQLVLRDLTGRRDALNPGGWTELALGTAQVTVWLVHTTSGRAATTPFVLPADLLAKSDYTLPFPGGDGVYTLHIRVSGYEEAIPLTVYRLDGLVIDPTSQVLIWSGPAEDPTPLNITTKGLLSGGSWSWTSLPLPEEYTYWSVIDANDETTQAGTFEGDDFGSRFAAEDPGVEMGSADFATEFVLTPGLTQRLATLAARLTFDTAWNWAGVREQAEAVTAWDYLFFCHAQLDHLRLSKGPVVADNEINRLMLLP